MQQNFIAIQFHFDLVLNLWRFDTNFFYIDKDNPEQAKKKFVEVANAYEVLSDPEKRKIYNLQGEEGVNQETARQAQNEANQHMFTNMGMNANMNFDEVFNKFFGGGAGGGAGGFKFTVVYVLKILN